MIGGACFYATLFGSVATLLKDWDAQQATYQVSPGRVCH
jgi:hypothetical protein